jgi:ribose transport system substrate-binding protein
MKTAKTRVFLGMACIAMLSAAFLPGCDKAPSGQGGKAYSVGMTVQDLSNPVWGGAAQEINRLIAADGGEFTFLETKNPNTQIQQVENFIAKKVNAIVIHVSDQNSLENVLEQARKEGIKVFCWDTDIENSDMNWLISNYELGTVIGKQAAQWIQDKFEGVAEYAVLNYDTEQILLERGNGIRDTLAQLVPNARKVADQSAINAQEGQTAVETILQANPNLKVIASIGGGGAVGANNAVKAAGMLTPDFGIFAADATELEIQAMENDEAVRMSVMITGSPKVIGQTVYARVKDLLDGKPVERRLMRELIPVTKENIQLAK